MDGLNGLNEIDRNQKQMEQTAREHMEELLQDQVECSEAEEQRAQHLADGTTGHLEEIQYDDDVVKRQENIIDPVEDKTTLDEHLQEQLLDDVEAAHSKAEELRAEDLANGTIGPLEDIQYDDDFVKEQENIIDPIEDRNTLTERNEGLQEQLLALKHDLSQSRDETKETAMDKIYRENVRQGRDKYNSLNEIRKGNTKSRVKMFENL